jgi:hypothetical protein
MGSVFYAILSVVEVLELRVNGDTMLSVNACAMIGFFCFWGSAIKANTMQRESNR